MIQLDKKIFTALIVLVFTAILFLFMAWKRENDKNDELKRKPAAPKMTLEREASTCEVGDLVWVNYLSGSGKRATIEHAPFIGFNVLEGHRVKVVVKYEDGTIQDVNLNMISPLNKDIYK